MGTEPDMVLLDRLKEVVRNPFNALGVEAGANWKSMKPYTRYRADTSKHRDCDGYHYGRIRYFLDQFNDQKKVHPVQVDTRWNYHTPTGLDLLDGHHRLAGAILAGVTKIPVDYSGPIDALPWLRGETDNRPDWL